MADAAPAVNLIASIASLVDLNATVATRLHEFASKSPDLPKLFRALLNRLQLLTATLQLVERQAQAGRLPIDAVEALQAVIGSTSTQVSFLHNYLSQICLLNDASQEQQVVKALKTLAEEDDIRMVVDKVHRNIDFLMLEQTTQYIDNDERILKEIARLQLANDQSPLAQRGHYVASVSAHGHSNVVLGDVHNYGVLFGQNQEQNDMKSFGLCLGSAPLTDADHFVGRAAELAQMKHILHPDGAISIQRQLVLGGMGGIGKTQLAIAYARLCQAGYTSVFWLNATTELTLTEGFRSIVRRFLNASELKKLDSDQIVPQAHDWLSDTRNTEWLLIFDNYDDPDQFAINDYVPNAAHGSVIITTRLPDLVRGQQVRVRSIKALDESLEILQTRSQRQNVKNDPNARRLAQRLAGLPLALVTAGAYLRKTTLTFHQYLEAYDQYFNVNPRRPVQLQEYQDRTLYTTWNLSYSRLENDDPLAAKALKLLAYFDNQEIWYGLLHAGLADDLPAWLQELIAAHIEFESTMGTLVDYCLLEVHPATQSFSVHNCVHDWTLAELNKVIDPQLYWYALNCVAASIGEDDFASLGRLSFARLTRHAVRCAHHCFDQNASLGAAASIYLGETVWVAELLAKQVQLFASEQIYERALVGYEKALGPDHTSTLDTVNNLGLLYADQGKLDEAEQMYTRALAGKEKALGPDHTSTLDTVNNLGCLYADQGKLDEAEQMYTRALAGYEKALGREHGRTLVIARNLSNLHRQQSKQDEIEQIFRPGERQKDVPQI